MFTAFSGYSKRIVQSSMPSTDEKSTKIDNDVFYYYLEDSLVVLQWDQIL
jgi:hypothetical protein